ncbi:MAG: peptidoglycan-binding protein [Limnothrix sp. RL_2_0]|nr:peptidoglycan-binding protein [Limnothrix sp. RL_2_0]
MNQYFGATPTQNPLQFWLKRSGSVGQCRPKLWGRLLGASLFVFGAIAIEIPGSAVLAQTACTTVKRGDRGATVSAVQQTLANNGYPVGTVDGVFGDMTEISIISFQRASNLDPDGVVGSATCDALIKLNNSTLVKAPTTSTGTVATATSTTTLKQGDSGPAVTTLQNSLRSRGFSDLAVTGVFDENTTNTVKRLQVIEGLPVTGEADPTTQTRLSQHLAKNPPATPVSTPTTPANPAPINQPPPLTTPAAPPAPTVFTPAQPANTPTTTEPEDGYNVIVPARNNDLLAQVRIIVPGANLGRTRLGSYVHAGTYSNRYDAESLSNKLKARGLDARVVKR